MIPTIKELELPLLILLSKFSCLSWDECTDKLSDQFNLSSEDREKLMPNGKCRSMKYRIGWAKSNLKRSGLVDARSRGVYYITKKGNKYVKDLDL